ncbi:MAG: hypothetical protein ABIK92_15370 [Pseudomonadota bacterium]
MHNFKYNTTSATSIQTIFLGLIAMFFINQATAFGQMPVHIGNDLLSQASQQRGVSEKAIRDLVDADLIKQNAYRSDSLGITGPVRQIQAGEIRWLPHGSKVGTVGLSILPANNSVIKRPIHLSIKYQIIHDAKGAVEINKYLSREDIYNSVVLALKSEQAVVSAVNDCLLALPVATPTNGSLWPEALDIARFNIYDKEWMLSFSKTGILPGTVEDRILIVINAKTLKISIITGVDTIEFARAAIASAGFDASQAEFYLINPGFNRKLPEGVTHKLLTSHWMVRAMGVKGCATPLWVPIEKYTMKIGKILEAPDPEVN